MPVTCPKGHPCKDPDFYQSHYSVVYCRDCDQIYLTFPVEQSYLDSLKKFVGETTQKTKG